jgi:hypothetical protein
MKVSQNRSHAVMAQRAESKESLDDFPTPPWATRALIEHVLEKPQGFKSQSCLEPACGEGHMAKVLAEYFGDVKTSDVYPYGYGEIKDFTTHPFEVNFCDWVITNPPFRLGEDFIHRALAVARVGRCDAHANSIHRECGPIRANFQRNTSHQICTIHRAGSDGERTPGR